MKTRFIKAISVPLFFAAFLPMIVVCGIAWIITGKYHPMEVTVKYFTWLSH